MTGIQSGPFVLAGLCAILLLASCAPDPDPDPEDLDLQHREELEILRAPKADSHCPSYAEGQPPEIAERSTYERRILSGSPAREALNAPCVLGGYSIDSLRAWAAGGDPVAEVALAYEQLQRDPSCSTALPLADRLVERADAQPRLKGSGFIRTPELYAVASEVYLRCKQRASSDRALKSAVDAGFVFITDYR